MLQEKIRKEKLKMKINKYDKVRLKNGREATIVEIYEQNKAYEVDILIDDTGEYP